jgi:hypothetical protein
MGHSETKNALVLVWANPLEINALAPPSTWNDPSGAMPSANLAGANWTPTTHLTLRHSIGSNDANLAPVTTRLDTSCSKTGSQVTTKTGYGASLDCRQGSPGLAPTRRSRSPETSLLKPKKSKGGGSRPPPGMKEIAMGLPTVGSIGGAKDPAQK